MSCTGALGDSRYRVSFTSSVSWFMVTPLTIELRSKVLGVCTNSTLNQNLASFNDHIIINPSDWWFGTMEFYDFPETVGNFIIPLEAVQRCRGTADRELSHRLSRWGRRFQEFFSGENGFLKIVKNGDLMGHIYIYIERERVIERER